MSQNTGEGRDAPDGADRFPGYVELSDSSTKNLQMDFLDDPDGVPVIIVDADWEEIVGLESRGGSSRRRYLARLAVIAATGLLAALVSPIVADLIQKDSVMRPAVAVESQDSPKPVSRAAGATEAPDATGAQGGSDRPEAGSSPPLVR